jgi:hypothetical protein
MRLVVIVIDSAAAGFLTPRVRAYPRPLPFAPTELTALAAWAEAHRPERLGEIRALDAARVRLAVPLRTRSEILGVLLLGEKAKGGGFSEGEKQVLRACADQFAAHDLAGPECYARLDIGRVTDLAAQALVFPGGGALRDVAGDTERHGRRARRTGCLRALEKDIRRLIYDVPLGTPVTIVA